MTYTTGDLPFEIPENIRDDIRNLNADLYHGPLYLGRDGEPCSMWDDGARPFNFTETVERVADWANDQPDVYECTWADTLEMEPDWGEMDDEDDDEEEPRPRFYPEDYTLIDWKTIVFGPELKRYI